MAVAGRSIPGLGFLGTLLRHDVSVSDDLRWYQRVLNRDQEGAMLLLDEALKTRSFEEVCDQIVIPILARADQDRTHEFIEGRDVAFIWRLVRDWLDDVAEDDEVTLVTRPESPASPEPEVEPLTRPPPSIRRNIRSWGSRPAAAATPWCFGCSTWRSSRLAFGSRSCRPGATRFRSATNSPRPNRGWF